MPAWRPANPGYDDDFQLMREEVNKLSGADADLICTLAEKLLTTTTKDIRVATYYAWARLHREGEAGLADGLDLLTISGLESEYLLRPKRLQDGHTEIYSVDSVNGSGRTGEAHYVPFTSFRHQGGMMRRHAPERYYHTRVKRGVTGMHDTWLILGGQQWEVDRMLERETVSLRITGTNGQLPRRALQSTLLDRCEQVYDTPLTVRNLCKPTLPAYPPAEDRFHWRVMSHLGSRFLNMMSSAEVLRGTLSLYNWRDDELNNRRLDAILDVRHHRIQRFEDGFLLRGLDVEVTLDSNGFTGEGDIHLFGELLNRFFALYADMNQFNQLTLIVQPEGKYIRWKENHSPRLPG